MTVLWAQSWVFSFLPNGSGAEIVNTPLWCHWGPWKGDRAENETDIQYHERTATFPASLYYAAAEPRRASAVEGSWLVRYKVMSILTGILSRVKLTIFDKWKDNPGAYYCRTITRFSIVLSPGKDAFSKWLLWKQRSHVQGTIQTEREGRKGDKTGGEGAIPCARQEALLLDPLFLTTISQGKNCYSYSHFTQEKTDIDKMTHSKTYKC